MKIGIDIDGVIANFYEPYEKLCIKHQGEDLFGDNKWPNREPRTWNWPESYGYTRETMRKVWEEIKQSGSFWTYASPMEPDRSTVVPLVVMNEHDVYFITSRPGKNALWQTKTWLGSVGMKGANVMLSNHKGFAAKALELDIYIDDKAQNIQECEWVSPKTHSYLLNKPYNVGYQVNLRVDSVKEMLEKEGL